MTDDRTTETCAHCGRELAASLKAWNAAAHARLMAAEEPDRRSVEASCARVVANDTSHRDATEWDCDRARIAMLEAALEKAQADAARAPGIVHVPLKGGGSELACSVCEATVTEAHSAADCVAVTERAERAVRSEDRHEIRTRLEGLLEMLAKLEEECQQS